MKLIPLAWRNIWRNRRRTTVTVAAMSLALWVTTVYGGMMQGYVHGMERDALETEIGDVQVTARGYLDRPSMDRGMEGTAEMVAALERVHLDATARLVGVGLVAAKEASAGAQLRGIDVERDARVLRVHTRVARGAWLTPGDTRGVVLGRQLARTLGVEPGDEVVLLGQAADGSMANDLAIVRGVLHPVAEATDRAGVFMTEQAFRAFYGYDGGAHQLVVRRPPELTMEALAAQVVAAAPGQDVLTWKQLLPTLATILESTRGLLAFVFFLVNIAIAIVVLNAMLMAVFERIREFGILKAVGAEGWLVLRLIYAESYLQFALAVAVGLAMAVPSLWYLSTYGLNVASLAGVNAMGLSMSSHWKAIIAVNQVVPPVVMMAAIVGVAVLYPAAKAALLQPVQAMHHT